jgi:hypothetical protein
MSVTVFVMGNAVVYKGSGGKGTFFPDVCLTQMGNTMAPIPYPNNTSDDDIDESSCASDVKFDGQKAATMSSFIKKSSGDSNGKTGVMSGKTEGGMCFLNGVNTVLIDGDAVVVNLMTLCTSNHAAKGPPGNTPPMPWLSGADSPVIIPPLQKSQKQKIKVAIRMFVPPDASSGAQVKLFTSDDQGGEYSQSKPVSSGESVGQNEVKFEFPDVVTDKLYSCFVDLGSDDNGQQVGMLVFTHLFIDDSFDVT